jgi:hypothetical protein
MKLKAITCMILTSGLIACGQADTANQHLGSMDESTKILISEFKKTQETLKDATNHVGRMANSIEALQKLGVDTVKLFGNAFKPREPSKTENIEDIFNDLPDAVTPQNQTEKEKNKS